MEINELGQFTGVVVGQNSIDIDGEMVPTLQEDDILLRCQSLNIFFVFRRTKDVQTSVGNISRSTVIRRLQSYVDGTWVKEHRFVAALFVNKDEPIMDASIDRSSALG